ncbi:MAG: hypothetical protein C0607_22650 [Azoarcus sp.]|nr:MAG: hypothetical protein C0607_22650 [Azoarcus sp.]
MGFGHNRDADARFATPRRQHIVKNPFRSLCCSLYVLALAGTVPAATAAEIVIGQVAPFTGTLAPTGNDVKLGIQAYFARVNAEGGVRGNTLRLVSRDDGYKVEDTLKQTTELIERDAPVALIVFCRYGQRRCLAEGRNAGPLGHGAGWRAFGRIGAANTGSGQGLPYACQLRGRSEHHRAADGHHGDQAGGRVSPGRPLW